MTPERALEHDKRCERAVDKFGGVPKFNFACDCAERALTAARQREEEAKGEIKAERALRLIHDACRESAEKECDTLRAENDRLTLAASESARTLQVEIERLKGQDEVHWKTRCTLLAERDTLKNQVTALRELLERHQAEAAKAILFFHAAVVKIWSYIADAQEGMNPFLPMAKLTEEAIFDLVSKAEQLCCDTVESKEYAAALRRAREGNNAS